MPSKAPRVRSKNQPPRRIEQLVAEIVESRILDGQLDECPLTLGEFGQIKESFTTTLRSMLHKRVSYAEALKGRAVTDDKAGTAKPPPPPRAPGARATRFEVIRGGGGRAA